MWRNDVMFVRSYRLQLDVVNLASAHRQTFKGQPPNRAWAVIATRTVHASKTADTHTRVYEVTVRHQSEEGMTSPTSWRVCETTAILKNLWYVTSIVVPRVKLQWSACFPFGWIWGDVILARRCSRREMMTCRWFCLILLSLCNSWLLSPGWD